MPCMCNIYMETFSNVNISKQIHVVSSVIYKQAIH